MKFYQYIFLFFMTIFSCSVTHASEMELLYSGDTLCSKEGEMCFIPIPQDGDEHYLIIGKTKKDQADGLYKCQIIEKDMNAGREERQKLAVSAVETEPFKPFSFSMLISFITRGNKITPKLWKSIDYHKEKLPEKALDKVHSIIAKGVFNCPDDIMESLENYYSKVSPLKKSLSEKSLSGYYFWLKCDLNALEGFCYMHSLRFTDIELFWNMKGASIYKLQKSSYYKFTVKQLSNDRWKVTERYTKLTFFYERGEEKTADNGLEGQPMHNKAENSGLRHRKNIQNKFPWTTEEEKEIYDTTASHYYKSKKL